MNSLLLLLPAWVAIAWLISRASWFWQHNPDLNFGWIVVMLCAYLFFEAWEKRPVVYLRWRWHSIGLTAMGIAILFLTQVYQGAYGTTSSSMSGLGVGTMLVVFGSLGFVFGGQGMRHFAMAFLFLLIALPIPSLIYVPVVNGLQSLISVINVEILSMMGIPAQRVGSLIHLPGGTVGIDEACSGIRSLQSTIMATLFIGYLTLKRPTLQVLLFVVGIFWAFVGNAIRSLYLSHTAYKYGIGAVKTAHDAAGWSILAFTVAGVIMLSWLLIRIENILAQRAPLEFTGRKA
jgi:exosortase